MVIEASPLVGGAPKLEETHVNRAGLEACLAVGEIVVPHSLERLDDRPGCLEAPPPFLDGAGLT